MPTTTTPLGTTQDTPLTSTTGAGVANFDPQFNDIIAQLLNPPEVFADVNRRSAETGAARGVIGSEAAFGTGLRMNDEERLRRIGIGNELLTSRETSSREQQVLADKTRELDLEERRIMADIALGNRTAANQEALTRIQRQRAEIDRDQYNLQRTIQAALGRGTDAQGNPAPQRINIAGSGWPANWVDWLPGGGT